MRSVWAGTTLASMANAYTVVQIYSSFMNKNIDPIVFPGSYTKSHMHRFFGSDAVTANTNTSAELQTGCTNAENPNDLSVYWVPDLMYTTDDGDTWTSAGLFRFSAYYGLGDTQPEVAIPQNLKMVAGNSSATTEDGSPTDAQVEWFCEDDDYTMGTNGFPTTTCSTHLQTLLYFPNCVNTETLETTYKSSSYGTTNYCPTGYNSMPQLRFSIRYDLRDDLPDGWSGEAPLQLASGNAWSSHGDFIMGWTEDAATNMVDALTSKYEFTGVDGDLGTYDAGTTCTQSDAEPDKGTSDYETSVELMEESSSTKRAAALWSRITRGVRN
ncbi:hypothetical protein BX600DRAFT_384022 [Xylariales sp. PMI_506]|nr:hypothetical protein BX600DRAFT_384022 [Xylariales sp. PMI_506]